MTSEVGILAAFAAGLVSFLSPCVLPLVPGYVSYVSGNKLASHRMRGRASYLLLSLVFVLGFSTIFVALGATATALSRLLFAYRFEAPVAGGAVVAMFGVFLTGLVRLPLLEARHAFSRRDPRRPSGAYLLGVAFGFGWTGIVTSTVSTAHYLPQH